MWIFGCRRGISIVIKGIRRVNLAITMGTVIMRGKDRGIAGFLVEGVEVPLHLQGATNIDGCMGILRCSFGNRWI